MNILVPITVTPDLIKSGTNIPTVDETVGEQAWVSGTDYVLGDLRVDAGYIYEVVRAVSGSPQNTYAPSDPKSGQFWLKDVPSNRMAPFDEYIYTKAIKKGEVRYVVPASFINGFSLYGVEADHLEFWYRETPGGVVLRHRSVELWEQAFGEWEYLFGHLQRTEKFTAFDLPLRPEGELEVRLVRNNPDVEAKLGMFSIGQWQTLLSPLTTVGGTQYGAEVTPKSYGYFKRNDDGTYIRKPGRTSKVITASVLIDSREAPRVSSLLERILDVPVAVEASNLPKYGHISTVGLVTGSVVAESWNTSKVNLKVDGNI